MSSSHDGAMMPEIRRSLMAWATGEHVDGARPSVVLESPHLLAEVQAAGLADHGFVFVPGSAGWASTVDAVPGESAASIVRYDGTFAMAGGEVAIGDDFFLQVQDYAAGAYMALLGPTIVSVLGKEDFDLFISDADRARQAGEFPEFLLAGPVRLANLPGLGGPTHGDGPHARLYIGDGGQVSTSPTGVSLAELGALRAAPSPRDLLAEAWRSHNDASLAACAVCLGSVVDESHRAVMVAARPWLARYHEVIGALRSLIARGIAGLRVSGFGYRLNADLDETAAARLDRPGTPVVAVTDDAGYLCDVASGRTFKLGLRAARAVEEVLAAGSPDEANRLSDPAAARAVIGYFSRAGLVASEVAS